MQDDNFRSKSENVSDRLIELYVERDESCKHGDWQRAHELQYEIDKTRRQRLELVAQAD